MYHSVSRAYRRDIDNLRSTPAIHALYAAYAVYYIGPDVAIVLCAWGGAVYHAWVGAFCISTMYYASYRTTKQLT